MPVRDPNAPVSERRTPWARSLTAKLVLSLIVSMTVVFGLLGYLIVRLHRQHLEQSTLASAERVSDVIRRSTTYYMLRNDREGLYHSIQTIADEPGVVKVRIFDQQGRISYSTDSSEVSHAVDKGAEACYGCHTQSQPLARLNRPDRFRIYRNSGGQRVLGIITPIENQPNCSNAECHAHPAGQQILGVLDTNLSLSRTDVQLAESSRRMLAYTFFALLTIGVLSWLFVWRVVGRPIQALHDATERLSQGDLGYQIDGGARDEVGDLARSFNGMSSQLHAANGEIVAWAKTLEDRVDQKTRELKRAHEHLVHVEKMASIGKMAAVVAHEVNNPLSGILTYAKLLRKWVIGGQAGHEKREETVQCLELIAAESRRCGDLVKNLLTLSRTAPMNLELTDLHAVIDRSLLLMRHQLEMGGIQLQLECAEDLPPAQCDPAQIEQVLLALVTNAIDAMPRGGNLWLRARFNPSREEIEIQVRDDGAGIASDLVLQIFEPFFTTKDSGHSVGLGLAVSRGIVERHGGQIEVQSELGKGTTFTVKLPAHGSETALVAAGVGAARTKVR
jgi:two-component system, NtrC family, sensor kinase